MIAPLAFVLAVTLTAPTTMTPDLDRRVLLTESVRDLLAHEFVEVEEHVPHDHPAIQSIDIVEELKTQDTAITLDNTGTLMCDGPCEVDPITIPIEGTGAERWRPLLEVYFPASEIDTAIRVIGCESGGDPNADNPSSTASGLFQMLRGWWNGTWYFDPFDPEENVKHAAILQASDGWYAHWYPSYGCWG